MTSKTAAKGAKKKTGGSKRSAKPSRAGGGSGGGGPAIPGSPKAVSTGKGPGAREIGEALVRDFNRGEFEINSKLWSPSIVSVEGIGLAWHGRKSVDAKNADWNAKHVIRGAAAEGPFVGSTGFAVKFRIDVEDRASRQRQIMDEVGVYTVQNGKIVREEFMYGTILPASAAAPNPQGG